MIKGSAPILTQQGQILWLTLAIEKRQEIKDILCQVLMSKGVQARKAAADAISTICTIELPIGQWSEFIPTLANNANHSNEDVVKASIMTLGYICEKFKVQKNSNLPEQTLQSILMGILLGMKKEQLNNDIKITAIKSLRDSFTFLDVLMDNEQVLTFVATQIIENCLHPDP